MRESQTFMLRLYSDVQEMPVEWLWFPYIPYGKVTILQGDPGEGKSTLTLSIIAQMSTGGKMPDGTKLGKALRVIYQCSEDGVADTIKPRLISAGADCRKIAFIDESTMALSLDDEVLREAVEAFTPKLVVIDPIQAYLGDADLSNANSVRKIMRRLSLWAERYGCAIVLVGHLNKNEGSKELYRSLGSIDVVAAARSVLQVESLNDDTEVRVLRQVKNSLAAKGDEIRYLIDKHGCLQWQQSMDESVEESPAERASSITLNTKQEATAKLLLSILANGPVKATEVFAQFENTDIGVRTIKITKKILNIKSYKKAGLWYWSLNKPPE